MPPLREDGLRLRLDPEYVLLGEQGGPVLSPGGPGLYTVVFRPGTDGKCSWYGAARVSADDRFRQIVTVQLSVHWFTESVAPGYVAWRLSLSWSTREGQQAAEQAEVRSESGGPSIYNVSSLLSLNIPETAEVFLVTLSRGVDTLPGDAQVFRVDGPIVLAD